MEATLNQSEVISISSVNVSFSTGKTDVKANDANKMTISVNNGSVTAGYKVNLTQSSSGNGENKRYTLSGTITGLEFTGCTDSTQVTFTITKGKDTYRATTTVGALRDGTETLDFGF